MAHLPHLPVTSASCSFADHECVSVVNELALCVNPCRLSPKFDWQSWLTYAYLLSFGRTQPLNLRVNWAAFSWPQPSQFQDAPWTFRTVCPQVSRQRSVWVARVGPCWAFDEPAFLRPGQLQVILRVSCCSEVWHFRCVTKPDKIMEMVSAQKYGPMMFHGSKIPILCLRRHAHWFAQHLSCALKGTHMNSCFLIAPCWKQHDFPFAVQSWMDSAIQLYLFTFFPWTWHLAVVKLALLIAGLPKSRAKQISCTPWLKKSLYQPPITSNNDHPTINQKSYYNLFEVHHLKFWRTVRL